MVTFRSSSPEADGCTRQFNSAGIFEGRRVIECGGRYDQNRSIPASTCSRSSAPDCISSRHDYALGAGLEFQWDSAAVFFRWRGQARAITGMACRNVTSLPSCMSDIAELAIFPRAVLAFAKSRCSTRCDRRKAASCRRKPSKAARVLTHEAAVSCSIPTIRIRGKSLTCPEMRKRR